MLLLGLYKYNGFPDWAQLLTQNLSNKATFLLGWSHCYTNYMVVTMRTGSPLQISIFQKIFYHFAYFLSPDWKKLNGYQTWLWVNRIVTYKKNLVHAAWISTYLL